MKLQIALLRAASLLVPSMNRSEWLAEWAAELSHVRVFNQFKIVFLDTPNWFAISDVMYLLSLEGVVRFNKISAENIEGSFCFAIGLQAL